MSFVDDLTKAAKSIQEALEQHTAQLADRKQADFDHNIQLGFLNNEVGSLRRELRRHVDREDLRWAALFDKLGVEDPCRG